MNRLETSTSKDGDDYSTVDEVGRKKDNEKVCSLPAHTQPCSEQVSCQESEKSGEGLSTEAESPKECTSIPPRTGEKAFSRASPAEQLTVKELETLQPPDSTVVGAEEHAAEADLGHSPGGDKEQTEGEDAEDEDRKAPLELLVKFVGALRHKDFELARKLCEMILIYDPEHPEASKLLPLIRMKLLKEQESDQSEEDDDDEEDSEEDDDEDDDRDTESDEKSFHTSSCSSSSSDDDGGGDGDEKQENRHKPCPPSYISP